MSADIVALMFLVFGCGVLVGVIAGVIVTMSVKES